MKKCPQCGLVNPPTALWCDCGQEFEPSEQQLPSAQPAPAPVPTAAPVPAPEAHSVPAPTPALVPESDPRQERAGKLQSVIRLGVGVAFVLFAYFAGWLGMYLSHVEGGASINSLGEVTVTFTNAGLFPSKECLRVSLEPTGKGAAGRRGKFPTERRGTVVCSGMIGAKETKEVSGRLYADMSALCPCTPLDKCCKLEVKGE